MRKLLSTIKVAFYETDKLLFSLCLIASAFGLLVVHSATMRRIQEGDIISRDALVMLFAVMLGAVIALVISFIDSEFIIRLWPFIAVFCIGIMCLLMTRLGYGPPTRPDVKTWIRIGEFGGITIDFQPSELVKIGFIITFGMHLDLVKDNLNDLKNLAALGVHAAIPFALVTITGDLGSALVFGLIFAAMIYIAGLSLKNLGIGFLGLLASLPFVWRFVFSSIQRDRFLAILNPEDYPVIIYQQEKGLAAIGSGGIFGQGLFKGEYTQAGIVPESRNDMIFTVIGEELGFVGCIAVLLILTFIILRVVRVGRQSKDSASALMCYGVAAMIAGHVIVNVGMCLMILPAVGITLPFFSSGGSSNLCLYIGIGLVLSINRFNHSREAVNFRLRKIRTPFSD